MRLRPWVNEVGSRGATLFLQLGLPSLASALDEHKKRRDGGRSDSLLEASKVAGALGYRVRVGSQKPSQFWTPSLRILPVHPVFGALGWAYPPEGVPAHAVSPYPG